MVASWSRMATEGGVGRCARRMLDRTKSGTRTGNDITKSDEGKLNAVKRKETKWYGDEACARPHAPTREHSSKTCKFYTHRFLGQEHYKFSTGCYGGREGGLAVRFPLSYFVRGEKERRRDGKKEMARSKHRREGQMSSALSPSKHLSLNRKNRHRRAYGNVTAR